jgi:hypothetical protein
MLYSYHIIICTMSCMPTGIYNNVHVYSSHIIICTVSCIPTSMYIIVYTSRYTWHCTYEKGEKNKACRLLYILVGIHDTVHMIRWEE